MEVGAEVGRPFVINVSINNCNEVSQRVGSPNKTMASILGKKSELDLDCNPLGIAERAHSCI